MVSNLCNLFVQTQKYSAANFFCTAGRANLSRIFNRYSTAVSNVQSTSILSRSVRSSNYKDLREGMTCVVFLVVATGGVCLFITTHENLHNKDYVLEKVKKYPRVLQFASDKLRDDDDVVLAAVKIDPSVRKYASKRLQNR